ncbi:hypothetical protein QVD17_17309 [Tagetes erecta]|uniref:Cyclin-dependent kinase inhibitor n=1 Tax=Tagetes erecta TaxID=13708 RepID=A0AAD8KS22_TARER|nr:hypothetical protein QVD17_17309 [Tagetes erecta]
MGKYMRKPKLTGDTMTVFDVVSHSSLGVRTRAKTLALQKLQALNSSTVSPPSPASEQTSYLQLRSRRLVKPPVQRLSCSSQRNPNPRAVNCSIGSYSVGSGLVGVRIEDCEETEEACFGENDCIQRSTRESTPCSSIKDINVICTPGSSTRSRNLETSNYSTTRSMPLSREIEDFFVVHEQQQHTRFANKYNFNFVIEKPLEGCYEWVKVKSQ